MVKQVGEDIWITDHDFAMGAIDFGGRMTVLRLRDGALLLYSAIPIDAALGKELAALGPVRHLVAPNAFHHLFLEAAAARYPEAAVYAPPALTKKLPALKVDVVLGRSAPEAWGAGVELLLVEGAPKVDEIVLYHATSKSVVLCDLVFHVHEARGWLSPLFFKMLGVWRKARQSPLWRWSFTADRGAAEASLAPLWSWDIERVLVAHGHVIEGPDSKAQLREALRWMCPGHARRALPAPA